jgi:hypothetical protein
MNDAVTPQPRSLQIPPEGTLHYKIIPAQFFIDAFTNNYLYFRRVDQYKDFRDSDLPTKAHENVENGERGQILTNRQIESLSNTNLTSLAQSLELSQTTIVISLDALLMVDKFDCPHRTQY